ncbi:MAG: hypothetical protein Q4G10_04455 [Bacteroidia bacterium]|nr:hypothetical protein [Bacteroidia bacterium]
MKAKIFTTAILSLIVSFTAMAQTVIKLNPESDGVYTLNATVNGVGVRTYYTEESWFASVSSTTYLFLYENGYIDPNDVKGMTVLKMPDGSTVKAGSFIIRNLRIGNVIVKDLPAFVIKKQSVPLVVGNSSFDCFGEVVLKNNELLIYDGIERKEEVQYAENQGISPQDNIRVDVQRHIDAGEYKEAAECLEALKSKEELSMYDEYQYILLLNALSRNDETITLAEKWLASYEGKTTYLDYWMFDALGDAHAKKGNHLKSINNYERAVSAYYAMFNMTEKDMLKSPRQDNTLGDTLFDLARQYAANGNVMKSQHCYFVSAKCGNATAIEVCKQYKITR